MIAARVVIGLVPAEHPPGMPFIQNDDVIEDVATDGADDALGERVLPWGSRCGRDVVDTEILHRLAEPGIVDAVPVAVEEAVRYPTGTPRAAAAESTHRWGARSRRGEECAGDRG